MNGKEYMTTQMTLVEVGKTLQRLDLSAFLRCIESAEASAPMLDPVLFRRASTNLSAIKSLAESALVTKLKFCEVQDAVIRTTVAHMTKEP